MKTQFKNRRIIKICKHYERVNFDIGTTKFCTQFNGLGGFNYFHLVDNPRFNVKAESFLNILINDLPISVNTKKKVVSGGRIQKITWIFDDGKIVLEQFGYDLFIFNKISYSFDVEKKIDFVFDYTRFVDVPSLMATVNAHYEKDNYAYYINLNGQKGKFNVAISFTENPKKMLKKTNSIFRDLNKEIDDMYIPEVCNTEEKKVLYVSSMFAALENYKEVPGYKALTAGVNYLSPFRTYFRDGYWTTLCLYEGHADLVKQQILTLAKGINKDGECPSAVKSDYSGFWGGHYDSPCFFIMMVSDYIQNTNEKSLLDEIINDSFTVIELCRKVIDRLMNNFTDKTHLIKKVAPNNKLDWADAVNRNGYVTYDEALYYRALVCLGNLIGGNNKYSKEAEFVKKSINEILWNENLGYYVNYIDGDFVEDNLSVDTILTVLFGIVSEKAKSKLIDKLENILYSKNHKDIEDFGVMTVYPNYKKHNSTVSISGQPFRYHNGANWPYWSGLFSYMLMQEKRDYDYALVDAFVKNVKKGNLTLLEYFSPYYVEGSNLQAWSSTCAFALNCCKKEFFKIK